MTTTPSNARQIIPDEYILQFCHTERQIEAMEALIKHEGNISKACTELNIARSTFKDRKDKIVNRAIKHGWRSGADNSGLKIPPMPEGQTLKGKSTLRDAEGNVIMEWVKTDKDKEAQEDWAREVLQGLKDEIKPAKKIAASKKKANKNLLNLYTLTDYHLGMLAWGEETGADWDLKIAEDTMVKAFEYLIDHTPDAEVGFFNELGDFEHYDSHVAVTPLNKHILDADGRPVKMIRASIRAQRRVIELMAKKYPKVVILNAEGNHNLVSSIWKRELFAEFYRNNPRIEVITDALPYYAFEWGKNMLGFHHGHLARNNKVGDVFISNYREMYGRTELLHVHTGHQHHRELKEHATHIFEMHPTLAAPDAYAARGGWNSQRAMQVITYHQDYMETSRVIVRPEML